MLFLNRNPFFSRHLPLILSVLLLLVGFGSYFLIKQSQPAQSAWYSPGGGTWNYRKTITIDHTKVNTATGTTTPLTNFPVLISLTDTDLKNNASSTGADILFTSSDGITKLNHEIETYSSSTGQLIAWVQVPSLSKTTDTVLYLYFGNTTAANQSNKTAVWDSNYKAVWHLGQTSGNFFDSTSNTNTGTPQSAITRNSSAKIDGGATFNGSNPYNSYISVTNNSSLQPSAAITMESWVYPTAATNDASIFCNDSWGASGYALWQSASGSSVGWAAIISYSGGNLTTVASTIYSINSWHHVVITYTKSEGIARVYVDGNLDNYSGVDKNGLVTPTYDLWIGASSGLPGTRATTGSQDEVRISNSARSADWIKTEYLNQSSPSAFAAIGGLQTQNHTSGQSDVKISNRGTGLGWYNTGGTWTNRRTIIIDHSKISQTATTTYSSFPFLFSSKDNELKYTGFSGGKVASSTGGDILFTASDGTTKLDYELESYSSSTGATVAWVRIPLLSAASDTTIYLYYGNASSGYQQNPTGVWDSDYKGVWHLPNGTALSTKDSTGNYNFSITGSLAAAPGKIYGGVNGFPNTNELDNAGGTSLNTTNWTASGWIYRTGSPSGYGNSILSHGPQAAAGHWYFYGNPSNVLDIDIPYVKGNIVTGATTIPLNTWAYAVATKNGNVYTVYLNGNSDGSVTDATVPTVSGKITAGNANASIPLAGSLDELRISGIARSADWIKTEYNNQNSPQTFYVLSGGSNPQTRPVNVPLIKSRGGVKFH
jgi:hypothetical protein